MACEKESVEGSLFGGRTAEEIDAQYEQCLSDAEQAEMFGMCVRVCVVCACVVVVVLLLYVRLCACKVCSHCVYSISSHQFITFVCVSFIRSLLGIVMLGLKIALCFLAILIIILSMLAYPLIKFAGTRVCNGIWIDMQSFIR